MSSQNRFSPPSAGDRGVSRGAPSATPAALAALLRAIDEVENGVEEDRSDARQFDLRPEVARSFPLSTAALDIIAALAPDASLTEARIAAVEARRRAASIEAEHGKQAGSTCQAPTPGELLRVLRVRAGVLHEQAADALGVSSDVLLRVEKATAPWHQVAATRLPFFASLVREPLEEISCCLKVAARRWLIHQVSQRASLALGRFDEQQAPSDAELSRLKLALAAVKEENQAAGKFFRELALVSSSNLESTRADR